MTRRNIALILAVCILATLLPATVHAVEPSDYIYGDGAAYIEVIPYTYADGTYTEDHGAITARGEAVYYAVKLTIPEDVSSHWYNAMVTSGVKLEYSNMAADATLLNTNSSPKYFCPPPYTTNTSWYLVNTAQGATSPSGNTNASIWQASFSADCVWTAYAETSAPEITATVTSESGELNVYHSAYYEITLEYNSANTLSSVTYKDMRQDGIAIKALLNSNFCITTFEITYNGTTYTTSTYNNDETAYMLSDQSTTLDFVCDIPGKKLKELCDTMQLDFGTVLSPQTLHTNYGWDTVSVSAFTWLARGETPAPQLNPEYCYTGSPIMTISNYEELSGATYKLYSKSGGTYTELTDVMTFPSADTFHLNLSKLTSPAYPLELAISATLPDCTESTYTDFRVCEPASGKEETITEVLPSDKSDNTTGNNGTGTTDQPQKPAEIWICGPVIRNDPNTPPELEIIRHEEANVPWYDEMHGHIHHGMEPYAYYSVNLENATIKDDHHMTVRFYFGWEHAGKKVWVLHKCSHHGYVERHEDLWVDRDGFVYITVHSFSPFVIGFDTTAESSSSSSGTSVSYKGGNSFTTSRSATPSSVEIDGVPVSFTGNGSSFTVSSIPAGAKWITVKWPGATVTFNFTPDAQACGSAIAVPKTGSISIAAYALLAIAAAAAVITKK